MKTSFDDVSPITGNLCVLVEIAPNGDQFRFCLESGYITMTGLTYSEKTLKELEESYPLGYKFRKIDKLHNLWVPITRASEHGALVPQYTSEAMEDFLWTVYKIEDNNFVLEGTFDRTAFGDAYDKYISNHYRSELEEE